MKGFGAFLSIIGAIGTVYGLVQTNTDEYKIASTLSSLTGYTDSSITFPKIALYGGIVVLIIGIIMLASGSSKNRN